MRNFVDRIEINPKILLGKPVFKGTRIPLYVILDLLAEGTPVKKIIKFYPDLTEEDIRASIAYGAEMSNDLLKS